MDTSTTTKTVNEQALIKLYMELTNTSEACARSVVMYVTGTGEEPVQDVKPASPLSSVH